MKLKSSGFTEKKDGAGQSLTRSVLEIVNKIPKGRVMTYGEIAGQLGTSPRAVGQALKRNTRPVAIPCHRVIMSDGSLGGYSGPGGVNRKAELLRSEGVIISEKVPLRRQGKLPEN